MLHSARAAALTAAFVVLTAGGAAARQAATMPELKGAFLVNFIKFTTWPVDVLPAGEPLVVCIAGDNRVADVVDDLTRERPIDGRRVHVRRIRADQQMTACHVLFWSASNDRRQGPSLETALARPILTISDLQDFAASGGIVNFFMDQGKMRFAVNPVAASRNGIRISSKLLTLATIVKEGNDDTR